MADGKTALQAVQNYVMGIIRGMRIKATNLKNVTTQVRKKVMMDYFDVDREQLQLEETWDNALQGTKFTPAQRSALNYTIAGSIIDYAEQRKVASQPSLDYAEDTTTTALDKAWIEATYDYLQENWKRVEDNYDVDYKSSKFVWPEEYYSKMSSEKLVNYFTDWRKSDYSYNDYTLPKTVELELRGKTTWSEDDYKLWAFCRHGHTTPYPEEVSGDYNYLQTLKLLRSPDDPRLMDHNDYVWMVLPLQQLDRFKNDGVLPRQWDCSHYSHINYYWSPADAIRTTWFLHTTGHEYDYQPDHVLVGLRLEQECELKGFNRHYKQYSNYIDPWDEKASYQCSTREREGLIAFELRQDKEYYTRAAQHYRNAGGTSITITTPSSSTTLSTSAPKYLWDYSCMIAADDLINYPGNCDSMFQAVWSNPNYCMNQNMFAKLYYSINKVDYENELKHAAPTVPIWHYDSVGQPKTAKFPQIPLRGHAEDRPHLDYGDGSRRPQLRHAPRQCQHTAR